jgi:hypothetical protein
MPKIQGLQQNILKELGIDGLPPERQEEILTVMTEAIFKRITLRLLDGLSEEQQKQFEEIANFGDPEKISQFFAANVPNYEKVIQEEVVRFKNDMTATIDVLLA